jgi:glutathione S-transferase
VRLIEYPAALDRDIVRVGALWNEGLRRFGGPFLAGSAFTAVDAFFAPVAFRVQTYGLTLDATADAYAKRLLDLDSMKEWYAAGIQETVRDPPHETEMLQMGTVLQDLRAR